MTDSIKGIILRWEKWRVGYNLILLAESLWLIWGRLAVTFADGFFMSFVVAAAIGANLCYCLGPVIDVFARNRLGSRTDRTRFRWLSAGVGYSLFWAGLGFSMLVVYSLVIHSLEYLDGYQP